MILCQIIQELERDNEIYWNIGPLKPYCWIGPEVLSGKKKMTMMHFFCAFLEKLKFKTSQE